MTKNNRRPKCDQCGKFISIDDLITFKAFRQMVTPDSEYTKEEFNTLCKRCYIP